MENLRTLPTRANKTDLPRKRRWSINAVYEFEKERIRGWLENIAAMNFSEANASLDTVLGERDALVKQLEGIYGRKGRYFATVIMQKAETGDLEREAGSWGLLVTFNILKWVVFSSEMIVFAMLMILFDASAMILVQGLLLALAGLLLGHGCALLLQPNEIGVPSVSILERIKAIGAAVLGLTGIIAICLIRTIAEPESALIVITVTSTLAILVAVFEALSEMGQRVYMSRWQQEFQAQAWWATEQHAKDYERGIWSAVYSERSRVISGERRRFFELPTESTQDTTNQRPEDAEGILDNQE